jgi:hypothetical protein
LLRRRLGARGLAATAALVFVCIAATASVPNVARPQDSSLATSPNTPPSTETMSPETQGSDASAEEMPRRGRGRGRRGGGGGGRASRAALVTRVLGVLTLLGAAGATYAILQVRQLAASMARLQDTVSSQARQLDEMRRSRPGA